MHKRDFGKNGGLHLCLKYSPHTSDSLAWDTNIGNIGIQGHDIVLGCPICVVVAPEGVRGITEGRRREEVSMGAKHDRDVELSRQLGNGALRAPAVQEHSGKDRLCNAVADAVQSVSVGVTRRMERRVEAIRARSDTVGLAPLCRSSNINRDTLCYGLGFTAANLIQDWTVNIACRSQGKSCTQAAGNKAVTLAPLIGCPRVNGNTDQRTCCRGRFPNTCHNGTGATLKGSILCRTLQSSIGGQDDNDEFPLLVPTASTGNITATAPLRPDTSAVHGHFNGGWQRGAITYAIFSWALWTAGSGEY
jgi:hypothetical protein